MKRILFAGLFTIFSAWAVAQDNNQEGFSDAETDVKTEQESDLRTLDDVIREGQNEDSSEPSARLEEAEIEIEKETADTSFEYNMETEADGSYEENLEFEVEGDQSNLEVEQSIEMDAATNEKSRFRKGIDYTAHGVKKGVQNTGEVAGDVGEVIVDGVTDVGERVGKGAKRSGSYLFKAEEGDDKSRARKGLDYTATGAKNAGEALGDVGEVVFDGVTDVGERVGKGVYRGGKAVVNGVGNLFGGNSDNDAQASAETEFTNETEVETEENTTDIEYEMENESTQESAELKTEEELECEIIETPESNN